MKQGIKPSKFINKNRKKKTMKELKINRALVTLLALTFTIVFLNFASAEKCHICDFSDEPIIVTPHTANDSRGKDVVFDFSDEPIIVTPHTANDSRGKDVVFDFSDEPIIVTPTK